MPDDLKTAQESKSGPSPAQWGPTFGSMSAMNQRAFECWAHGMSRLFHEMAQFMQSRLLEDSEMWEMLAACRDPAAALECQRQFTVKASADYAEASQKFAGMILEIGQTCSTGLRHAPPETD